MIFELLFLAMVLATLCILLASVVMLIRGKRRTMYRTLATTAIVWAAYLLVVVAVAAATAHRPQRVLALGQQRCFDEMCFAVIDAKTTLQIGAVRANGVFYVVSIQATSRSRGRPQREAGLRALLWSNGHTWRPSPDGQAAWDAAQGTSPRLDIRLEPGQSIVSTQVFDVPAGVRDLGVTLTHGFTPGYFVIGECPLFHKPVITRIQPD